jgi:hypothetical protein
VRTKLAIITGFSLLMLSNRSMAASITLYDGASGVTPDNYPNTSSTFFKFDSLNGGAQQASGGVTNLNTTPSNSAYAGYSNYNATINLQNPSVFTPTSPVNTSFPVLDRNAGYTFTFTVKINSESDTNDSTHPRAGFSVIVLSSDKQGIEIGFSQKNSSIFSQDNSSFNKVGESYASASSLLTNSTQYDLTVSGNQYTLSSSGNNLLNGSLRDYTAATGFVGSDVYKTSNFIFLGDDTGSAQANIDLKYVALTTNSAGVPYKFSPSIGILMLAACGAVTHLLKNKNS